MVMLTKKSIVPISIRGGHTFCWNGRSSFIDNKYEQRSSKPTGKRIRNY